MSRAMPIAGLLCAFALAGCATAPPDPWTPSADTPGGERELLLLESFLTGFWTSQDQAKSDKDFADIRLRHVPIWTERTGEHWMYVEQALAGKEDAPYRQRVYRLVARKGRLFSLVYTLPGDPLRFAGEWKKAQPLANLQPEDLVARAGCTVVLERQMETFFNGGTKGKECPSDLRGAAYATSEVSLTSAFMRALDRGFDAEGKQVWGSTKGPYEFSKISREMQ